MCKKRSMTDTWALLVAAYGCGVLVGLARVDAKPGVRLGLAVLWPLGPLAFAATLGVLLMASVVAFPLVGAAVLLAAAAYSACSL